MALNRLNDIYRLLSYQTILRYGSTISFRFLPIFRYILGADWDLRTRIFISIHARIPPKKSFISKVSSRVVRGILSRSQRYVTKVVQYRPFDVAKLLLFILHIFSYLVFH